jgi:sulfonate transport system substrate-binding protein
VRTPLTRRALTGLLALALVGGLLAACSSSASTRTAGATGAAETVPPATVPASIPAGTVLRVGDQLDYLKTVLKLAGEDQNFPYKVDYSAFIGGPPMLQAFQGKAIDTGFVGSTPLIFAQAGQQDIKAVAGWASEHGSYGLVTSDPSITGWGDLKGKRVAYQQGTAGEAAVLQALDTAGLALSDITPVNVPQTQVSATLQGGSADAGISIEPLTSVYLASNPNGKVVARAQEITDRSSFIIASQSTLDDAGKSAALGDYLSRLVRSFVYLNSHRDQVAQAVYVDQYKLTPERAAQVVADAGSTSFIVLPGDIVPAQQRLADLFHSAGEIPNKVDVGQEFDPRFNQLVQQAASS